MSAVPICALALLFAGCSAPAPHPSTKSSQQPATPKKTGDDAPIGHSDPCATRLHELCGPLLLYYATNRSLPAKLEELNTVGMDMPPELISLLLAMRRLPSSVVIVTSVISGMRT